MHKFYFGKNKKDVRLGCMRVYELEKERKNVNVVGVVSKTVGKDKID